jgi:hypothetical protein
MSQIVLIWTCIFVFISTSIITLLGIINKISIDKSYLNKLFIALILEVVAIGVLAFKDNFKPTKCDFNFTKITFPNNNFIYDTQLNTSLFIDGAFKKVEGNILSGELEILDKKIQLNNTLNADNLFKFIISNDELEKNSKGKVRVTISNKLGYILYCDSLWVTIK